MFSNEPYIFKYFGIGLGVSISLNKAMQILLGLIKNPEITCF